MKNIFFPSQKAEIKSPWKRVGESLTMLEAFLDEVFMMMIMMLLMISALYSMKKWETLFSLSATIY